MGVIAHHVSDWVKRTHHSIVLADVLLKPLPLTVEEIGWVRGGEGKEDTNWI